MSQELDLRGIAQSEKEYKKILDGRLSNEIVAGFYEEREREEKQNGNKAGESYYNKKASDVRDCHSHVFFNHYQKQGVKDFRGTIRCLDRFCPLCAKDVANSREYRFKQILDKAFEKFDLFHITFTMRNCRGEIVEADLTEKNIGLLLLPDCLQRMSKCSRKLIRYLSGDAKIAGVDFAKYGYAGMIRSLEITFNNWQIYHPHHHCIIALKKGVELPGENYNDFSYDNITKTVTPFSDFEILLQKIWFMILNNKTVIKSPTKKNPDALSLDTLRQGYSVRARKLEHDDYHQTFKYVVKPEKNTVMSYEVFKDLSDALYKKRVIQGTGFFRGFKVDDEIDDGYDSVYDEIVKQLMTVELPVRCSETPGAVHDNIMRRKYIYISRKRVRAFVREYGLIDEIKIMASDPERIPEFVQLMYDFSKGDVDVVSGRTPTTKPARRISEYAQLSSEIKANTAAYDFERELALYTGKDGFNND